MSRLVLILLLSFFIANQVSANLPPAKGNILLTVTGKINHTNLSDSAVFDLQLLESLEQQEITTHNPWSAGSNVYRGPLGRALIKAVGAEQANTMRVTSLNGFIAEIPISDLIEYDVIFALQKNGQPQRIRDRGPLFTIYPFDQYPHLNTEMHYNRSVWQVKSIEFF